MPDCLEEGDVGPCCCTCEVAFCSSTDLSLSHSLCKMFAAPSFPPSAPSVGVSKQRPMGANFRVCDDAADLRHRVSQFGGDDDAVRIIIEELPEEASLGFFFSE